MKKIISLTLLLAAGIGFTACVNEEDDLFDKTAAERLNEASALYSSRLMAQPNGWAMQLYPTNDNEAPYGSGYLVLCRFNKDHSVVVSMKNQFTDNVYRTDTSLWEVITDNGPVLSFNSHNDCLHAFTDPEDILWTGNPDEPNNETGTGVGGDYEFIIVDAPEDASYMMLKGKKRGTYNLFTPVEEGVEYESYLADVGGGVMNVTFEPRCRNNWHIHHKQVQVLICVAGRGWYQEWGKPAVEMTPGTVIAIPAEVKHWHGAQKDSWFQHLTYHKDVQEGASNEWCEPVDDAAYDALK